MEPREADMQVMLTLGTTPDAVANYIWDHWLGEPESPTYEEVLHMVRSFEQ
jgi:hypothetical protein